MNTDKSKVIARIGAFAAFVVLGPAVLRALAPMSLLLVEILLGVCEVGVNVLRMSRM